MTRFAIAAFTALVLAGPAAAAASPEDDYIAARNGYVKQIRAAEAAKKKIEDIDKIDAAALADLKVRLLAVVGPSKFKGVMPEPAFSPATLQNGNIETGDADGLRYGAEDGSKAFYVSTPKILLDWLAGRAAEEKRFKPARDIGQALANDEIYYSMIASGAALTAFAEIPVKAPAGATATRAFLGHFSQDVVTEMPTAVIVATATAGRVVVGMVESKNRLPVPKECAAFQKKQMEKFAGCITKRIPSMPEFAAFAKDAEALLKEELAN